MDLNQSHLVVLFGPVDLERQAGAKTARLCRSQSYFNFQSFAFQVKDGFLPPLVAILDTDAEENCRFRYSYTNDLNTAHLHLHQRSEYLPNIQIYTNDLNIVTI